MKKGRPHQDDPAPLDTPHPSVTALSLLNEQIIAANVARYVAGQLIAVVIDRMTVLQMSPEVRKATLETLRTNMHGEVDRLIDEAAS